MRYNKELYEQKEALHDLKSLEKTHGTITLLYAAKTTTKNHAVVLQKRLKGEPSL